jgi:hypothetical protein
VTLEVENTSATDGHDVIQVYVSPVNPSVLTPKRTLANFKKVSVPHGRSVFVPITLDPESFMIHDRIEDRLVTLGGKWSVEVSKDAHTPVFSSLVDVSADDRPTPDPESLKTPESLMDPDVFEAYMGHDIPDPDPVFPYTRMSPLEDLKHRLVGRMVLSVVDRTIRKRMTGSDSEADLKMIDETKRSLPLKSLTSFAGIKPHVVDAFIHILNRKPLKALLTLATKKG